MLSSSPIARARWESFSQGWRALRHRNFRLFFSGQSVSLIGTWMTRIATSWLIFRLTGSSLMLGTVSFAGQIPAFLLAPFAGVFVDRWDKRKILIWTQVLSMVQSLALAVLALTHLINIPEVIALSIMQGCINAFDMPGRQSFMIRMVDDRNDLQNAIALNSTMVNMARFIGPSLAAAMIAASNEGWCFLVDGVSYIFVLFSLGMMRVPRDEIVRVKTSMARQLAEGWQYVTGSFSIRTILTYFAIVNLMGWPFMVLLPIFSTKILHGNSHTYGLLMGAVGVGSMLSALRMAARKTADGLPLVLAASALLFGIGLVFFSFSPTLWLSLVLLALVGFGTMQSMSSTNTLLQTLVDDRMRGRVMSYFTMGYVGMAPIGSLLGGAVAHAFGPQLTVLASGLATVAVALWFFSRRAAVELHVSETHAGLASAREA